MALRKAITTPPGEPTEYVDLTPVEEAARQAEADAYNDPGAIAERLRLATANRLDVRRVLEALVVKTNAIAGLDAQDRDAINARREGRGEVAL